MTLLKNTHELETDNLKVILRSPKRRSGADCSMKIFGFYKKDDPKTIYHLNYLGVGVEEIKKETKRKDIKLVDAYEKIHHLLKNHILQLLERKLEQNLTDYSVYDWSNPQEWKLGQQTKDLFPQIIKYYNIENILSKEVINIRLREYDNYFLDFDLSNFNIKEVYCKNEEEIPFLDIVVREWDYKQILIAKQFIENTAPQVVYNIFALNEWFKGKKSVWLVLENGEKYKFKSNRGYEPKFEHIFTYSDSENEYVVNDSYYFNHKLGRYYDLSEVKGFKYSSDFYPINKEDFKTPEIK
jgi:hypothetical protein